MSDLETAAEPSQNGALSFDLTETVIPVKIKQKDGTTKKYELHEATEDDVVKWRDSMLSKANVSRKTGQVTVGEGVSESAALLVSLCLMEIGVITKSGEFVPHAPEKQDFVHVSELRKWPSRIVSPIHRKLMEISELDEEDESGKN